MIALDYENIIRAAFDCERGGKHGATTDQYYPLIHVRNEFDKGVRCGFLAAYMLEALDELRNMYLDNTEFQTNIKECIDLLEDPTVDNINNSIIKASKTLKKIGLISEDMS